MLTSQAVTRNEVADDFFHDEYHMLRFVVYVYGSEYLVFCWKITVSTINDVSNNPN